MGTEKKFSLDSLWKLLTVLVIATTMAACSSSGTSDDEGDLEEMDESAELAEAGTDEVPEDSLEDLGDEEGLEDDLPEGDDLADEDSLDEPELGEEAEEVAEMEEPVAPEEAMEEPAMEEPAMEEPMETAQNDVEEMAQPTMNEFQSDSEPSAGGFAGSGNFESYTVRGGDTLMKIAFEYYGDLYQWKRIYDANRDKISDPNMIPSGTVLNIERPSSSVAIDRNGERYTIKQGDTLGSISAEVYGTSGKWRKLWNNNRQLIKDPNRIFAGFDLYYTPEAGYEPQMAAPEAPAEPMNEEVQAVVDESSVDPGDMREPANQ